MVCIIFSDTHGNYNLAAEALIAAGHVDLIFHLGDVASDAAMLEQIFSRPVGKVAGNCDPPGILPRELSTEIETVRVLLTHGDSYNVKSGLMSLRQRAVATNSQVVLYGHTHNAVVDEIDGILFINPGSLHQDSSFKSYARLIIENDRVSAEIIALD
jgi:putative phosphoesterase